MSPELIELFKTIVAAMAGTGVVLMFVAKFGQSWFLKKIDSKFAFALAEKNNQLMGDLERKKNDLNKELQIEVTHFKSQLEVFSGQQSKFLEKKVTSILTLNQKHYLAVKNIKMFTDVIDNWVLEAMLYFEFENGEEEPSDYEVYRRMKEERLPSFEKKAKSAFDDYSECLALNMPILPPDLVKEEMEIIDSLNKAVENTSIAFARAMSNTVYIMNPVENDTTQQECISNLKKERKKAAACKKILDDLSDTLFEKARNSGNLIEKLINHNVTA